MSATKITSGMITDAAITTAKVNDSAITTAKINDAAITAAKIANGVLTPFSAVRQTVQGGPTSSGLPNFWPAATYAPSVSSLNLSTSGVSSSDPLVVSASQGFGSGSERIGTATANLTWTALTASTTNYLYVDVAADGSMTTGHTVTAPVYSYTASSGTNTFNITTMTMYSTGTTKAWRVFVGEAVTGVGSVSSVVHYVYNGKYNAYSSAVTPLPTTAQTITHNIGVVPKEVSTVLECITADAPYSQGDIVIGPIFYTGADRYPGNYMVSYKQLFFRVAGSFRTINFSGGGEMALAASNWKYWIEADRGW